jgi:hypothetical protein
MFFRRSLEKILTEPDSVRVLRALYERLNRRGPLNPIQEGVSDTWWLFAEVSNGTIHQYLCNSTSDHFYRLHSFLVMIGAVSADSILSSITKLFPESKVPSDRFIRKDLLDKWAESVGELEAERIIRKISNSILDARIAIACSIVDYIKNHQDDYEKEPNQ